jgi:hypothetical protein
MTERLAIRYRDFQALGRLPRGLSGRASAPLLISPHERWAASQIKLLVVGQETLRWQYEPEEFDPEAAVIKSFREFSTAKNGVAAMLELYRRYELGRQHPKLNSPFWRGFRALDTALNPAVDSALWTNLFKVNVNGSVMRNCTRAEIAAIQKAQQGLLRHEIDVLKPDVVVFFTGPRYDSAIRAEFPDVEFLPFDEIPASCASLSSLALIRASGLPAKTVRSYHPEYLQRSRQLGSISVIAEWAKR